MKSLTPIVLLLIFLSAGVAVVAAKFGPTTVQISSNTSIVIDYGKYQPLAVRCDLEKQRCTLKSAGVSGTPYVPEFEITGNPGDKPGVLYFKISNARVEPGEKNAAEIRQLQDTHYAILVPTDGNWYTFNVYRP